MLNHRVEYGQDFTHTGCYGHLGHLASFNKSLVETSNNRVTANSAQSSHIESGSDGCSTTADATFASPRSAVIVEGSQPHQSSDLFAVELPQFRNIRKQ